MTTSSSTSTVKQTYSDNSYSQIITMRRGESSISQMSPWEDEMGATSDQLFLVTSYR